MFWDGWHVDRRKFIGAVAGNLVAAPIIGRCGPPAAASSATASDPRETTATLAPNSARRLGTYASGLPGSRNITDYSGIAFDRAGRRMCLFGGGHGPSQETDIRVLDMESLEWSSLYPPTPRSEMTRSNGDSDLGRWISTNQPYARHTYNMTVVAGRRFYMFTCYGQPDHLDGPAPPYGGRVCWYDFDARTWSYSRYPASKTPWMYYAAAALDPRSGKIVIAGLGPQVSPGNIWLYDPGNDTYVTGPPFPPAVGYAHDLVYFPPGDCFYALQSDGRVWRVVIDRAELGKSTVTNLDATGRKPTKTGRCGFAYDSLNERIGGNITNGIYYAFDPVSLTWSGTLVRVESGSDGVPDQVFHCLDFDIASGCFVLLDQPGTARTWLYRPATMTRQVRRTRMDIGCAGLGDA